MMLTLIRWVVCLNCCTQGGTIRVQTTSDVAVSHVLFRFVCLCHRRALNHQHTNNKCYMLYHRVIYRSYRLMPCDSLPFHLTPVIGCLFV